MKPKLILCYSCWRAWSAILRVIPRLLKFGYAMYLWALKCFVVALQNTSQLLVIFTCFFCLIENYPLGEGVDAIHNVNRSRWTLRLLVSSILASHPHMLESFEHHNWVSNLCFFLKTNTHAKHVWSCILWLMLFNHPGFFGFFTLM